MLQKRRISFYLAALTVSIQPEGLDEHSAHILTSLVLNRSEVMKRLSGHRYHVLRREFGENLSEKEQSPETNRILVYDYITNQLLSIEGGAEQETPLSILESSEVLQPTPEEFQDAIHILHQDPYYGSEKNNWKAQPAMPGLLHAIEGSPGRIIAIDLLPLSPEFQHEIVGVNLSNLSVLRFPGRAPPTAQATQQVCGPPDARQGSTGYGLAGRSRISIKQGDTEIWNFTVIRPSSSSGAWGSAIDLRNIFFKGKKVASQMHAPILNVKYDDNVCGPYRDWSYSEGKFQAQGTLLVPGILKTSSPPQTIFDTNSDVGNFNGVAVYNNGNEVLLVSQLHAAWYRYVSIFRFYLDGTIQPQWGFSAVQNSCTCKPHHHHIYWRFDFDIGTGLKNRLQVYDGSNWNDISKETKQFRDSQHQLWRILDTETGSGYLITPGIHDGTALGDHYGKADLHLLRYHRYQIDDSFVYRGTSENIDAFINGENLNNQDVVLWYAGHFFHVRDEPNAMNEPILGPILTPIQW